MAKAFSRKGSQFVASLDPVERGLVVGLMEQVLALVEPETVVPVDEGTGGDAPTAGDEFDQIVAGLGGLGMGVSVAGEDQVAADEPPVAPRGSGHDDPALNRLLPDANREDPEASAEFRRLTEDGLRSRKAQNLRTAVVALSARSGSGDKVVLDQPQALATVVALTDVRLVLGERLGLRTDEDADLIAEALEAADDDDPAVYAMAVYDFLTWLQEGLASALMR